MRILETFIKQLMAGGADGAADPPTVAESNKALDDFGGSQIQAALVSFPMGREMMKKAVAKRDELKHIEGCLSELKELLAKPKFSSADIAQMNRMAQRADLFGAKIANVITIGILSEIMAHTLAVVLMKLFPCDDGGHDSLRDVRARVEFVDQSAAPILESLLEAKALHMIHSDTELWPQVYEELLKLIALVDSTKRVNDESFNEEAATKVLFGLHGFKKTGSLYTVATTVLDEGASERIYKWHVETLAAEVGDLCRTSMVISRGRPWVSSLLWQRTIVNRPH